MSENKHTQEPWHLCEVENETGRIKHLVPVDAEKMSLLTIVENDQATFAAIYNDDDARRIVACVNACAGIPTYQLTAENDNPTNLGEVIDAIRDQRDELLAALENCRLLAARHRKEEWAGHVLRFCGESGVAGEVMR